jgi:glycolate oxidase FAD binding subunit
MSHPCTIDGFGPVPVARPASVAELCDLVRRAAAEGQALYPLGGRTMLDLGLPPTRPGLGIDFRSLNQVIDYPARDMTITVQAGITIAELQELLRRENQRLPIDVPCAGEATLGGALATNVSGPRRLGFGTLRDYVIGITVITDEGHEAKAGGRVVKNVAGYDLCKLHIGALGTLGIITQVTLKLRPLPEDSALCVIDTDAEGFAPLLDRLHTSAIRPVCVEVLNAAATRALQFGEPAHKPWRIIVGFEENRAAVAWQVERLSQELAAAEVRSLRGPEAAPLWAALTELPGRAAASLVFKANLLPSGVAAFCQKGAALSDTLELQTHAGSGIVIGQREEELSREAAERLLQALREQATTAQGNLVIRRCPPEWKKTLPVSGTPRDDQWLMQEVKSRLDPKQLFNPGRLW